MHQISKNIHSDIGNRNLKIEIANRKKIVLFTFLETSIIFAMKNEVRETPDSFIEKAITIKQKYYRDKSPKK